jgi:tetratricopeptide (TPR) repeat protein
VSDNLPPTHFQRFTAQDAAALERQVADLQQQLRGARLEGDSTRVLELIETLGGMLTTARREREAWDLLAPAVEAARERGACELLGWLLLQLGTAAQYLGKREGANRHFSEALTIAEALGLERLTHFTLSHWARSLVEEGDLDRAEAFFERALEIRVRLRDPREASSRRALVAVARLKACRDQPSQGPGS